MPQSRRPFPVIVGVPRSGTTLLRLLLDAHPQMVIPPETPWLGKVAQSLRTHPADLEGVRQAFQSGRGNNLRIPDSDLDAIFAAHDPAAPAETVRRIYDHYRCRHAAPRVGDKTPAHLMVMDEIAAIMPEAHFIHIIRDGRDVAVSLRPLWFGPGQDMAAAGRFWAERIRNARQQALGLPHYLEVRYEALVQSPETVLRKIAGFIDLPFDPVQLRAYETAEDRIGEFQSHNHNGLLVTSEMLKGIHALTSSPPDPSRVGRWMDQLSAEDKAAFEATAADMLSELGYC